MTAVPPTPTAAMASGRPSTRTWRVDGRWISAPWVSVSSGAGLDEAVAQQVDADRARRPSRWPGPRRCRRRARTCGSRPAPGPVTAHRRGAGRAGDAGQPTEVGRGAAHDVDVGDGDDEVGRAVVVDLDAAPRGRPPSSQGVEHARRRAVHGSRSAAAGASSRRCRSASSSTGTGPTPHSSVTTEPGGRPRSAASATAVPSTGWPAKGELDGGREDADAGVAGGGVRRRVARTPSRRTRSPGPGPGGAPRAPTDRRGTPPAGCR